MAWKLTEGEQAAIMEAAWGAIKPWMTTRTTTITWVNGDGTERPLPIKVPALREDAPPGIKALNDAYETIIDSGAAIAQS